MCFLTSVHVTTEMGPFCKVLSHHLASIINTARSRPFWEETSPARHAQVCLRPEPTCVFIYNTSFRRADGSTRDLCSALTCTAPRQDNYHGGLDETPPGQRQASAKEGSSTPWAGKHLWHLPAATYLFCLSLRGSDFFHTLSPGNFQANEAARCGV